MACMPPAIGMATTSSQTQRCGTIFVFFFLTAALAAGAQKPLGCTAIGVSLLGTKAGLSGVAKPFHREESPCNVILPYSQNVQPRPRLSYCRPS
jgi:hypothetical protein